MTFTDMNSLMESRMIYASPTTVLSKGNSSSGQRAFAVIGGVIAVVMCRLQALPAIVKRRARLWREYRSALTELYSLSATDLRDLRMASSELTDIAWAEACRRVNELSTNKPQ